MKKAIIICAAGMSSSLMAKKTTDYLQSKDEDIEITATTVMEGEKIITNGDYDLYMISPQARMYFEKLKALANKNNKKIILIPFDAYAPVQMGIEKLAHIVLENIQ